MKAARADADMARHVLDIIERIMVSGAGQAFVDIESTCACPALMPERAD